MTEMIPCPFTLPAGVTHELFVIKVDVDVHAVCCKTCGATGPIENYHNASQTAERAIELWNAGRGWQPTSAVPAVTERTEILFAWPTHHDVLLLWPDGEITDRDEDPIARDEWPSEWRTLP